MNCRQIDRRRLADYAAAARCFEEQARDAARAGNLDGAVAWARAAVATLRGDPVLAGEAELLLDRLIERQRDGGAA